MWIYCYKNKKNNYQKFKKKNNNFKGRLTYATPKTIGICMENNSLVQTNNIDVLGIVSTYLKQKKLNVIEEILE